MKKVFISYRTANRVAIEEIWRDYFAGFFHDETIWKQYSASSQFIANKIRERISRSDAVVCLADHETYLSGWVDWEIATSFAFGKVTILMSLPGVSGNPKLPASASGRRWLRWNPDVLRAQIDSSDQVIARERRAYPLQEPPVQRRVQRPAKSGNIPPRLPLRDFGPDGSRHIR